MFIGNVDVKLAKVLEKRMQRKIKSIKQLGDQSDPEKSELVGKVTVLDATFSQVEENMYESSSTSEIDFQIDGPSTSKARQTDLRGVDFRNLAEACDRTGVSDRRASFLANVVLQDLGIVSPIGKLLPTCQNLPVVKFEKIDGEVPEFDLNDTSTDQVYFYEMCSVIAKGDVPPNLSKRYPGKMAHARWLTTANRILRLYVASEQPSNELKTITEFILKVYAPVWFDIKVRSSCTEGSRHLFSLIRRSRYLPAAVKDVIDPVIQRNAFFAHKENILLSMLTDDRKPMRELALKRIL
ncbi:unnamed protein product [Psylliodes chrysocephalus]|uniref:Uncharacterized protein n=1 Tax=Psylliodes chrysocephalus TaxID=3402493 RepID=A0A9P0CPU4_9CUCU|nr:unnamed protein product [Psylliodes chrysocephala]